MLGRNCRLKERGLIHLYLRYNHMAQVTYRGVKYDTQAKKQCSKVEQVLTYRGSSYPKELQTCEKG